MEKIIFFALVFPILGFVLYLGGSAIMKGFKAKGDNNSNKNEDDQNKIDNFSSDSDQLSNELAKLNELYKSGVLTQEEFDKAKKKLLDN